MTSTIHSGSTAVPNKGKQPETLLDTIADGLQAEQASRVVTRSTAFAVAGGLSGAGIAAYHYAPAIPAAFQSALSTGTTAFGFFALREYLVAPTFTHLRRTGRLSSSVSPHFHHVGEASSAGAATGAILGGYHFGLSRRIATGGLTFAILAALGQLGFNQLNLARIRYLQRRLGNEQQQQLPHPQALPRVDNDDESTTTSTSGSPSTAATLPAPVVEPAKPPFFQRLTERLLAFTPIRKVSDVEYTETLRVNIRKAKDELEIVDRQIADAERDLEALRGKAV